MVAVVAIGSAARGSRFTRGANRRLREARRDEWARLAGRSLAEHVDGWAHVQRKAPLLVSEIESLIVALFPDPTEELLKSRDPFDDPLVAQSFFFWVGVGILAGFNERWVKRLISQPVSDKRG